VAAKHDYHPATKALCIYDGLDHSLEIAGYEHIRKRFEKRAEASIIPWGRRKLFGSHLVRPTLDRNCADL